MFGCGYGERKRSTRETEGSVRVAVFYRTGKGERNEREIKESMHVYYSLKSKEDFMIQNMSRIGHL